jgi:hypothetical protein
VTSYLRVFDSRIADLGEVRDIVDRSMAAGVEAAQRLVPIDTGALRDSIAVVDEAHVEGAVVVGTYGAGEDYALHVEFGTSVGPEQPYLRPSIDAVLQEAKR